MIPGEQKRRPGRPPIIDLAGKTFGHLTVIERDELSGWKCLCKCGKQAVMKTEDLRWNGRKSCGCGYGRGEPREGKAVGGGMVLSTTLRSVIPERLTELFRQKYQRRSDNECPLCGFTPARRLTCLYGVRSTLFHKVVNDFRNYIACCELCYEAFLGSYKLTPDRIATPALWAPIILGNEDAPRAHPLNRELLKVPLSLYREQEPRMPGVAHGLIELKALALADDVLGVGGHV